MGLFDNIWGKKPEKVELSAAKPKIKDSTIKFSASPNEVRKALETPLIIKERGRSWMKYGSDNRYPDILNNLAQMSPIHSGIVNGRARCSAGRSLLFDGLKWPEWRQGAAPEELAIVDFFLKACGDLEELKNKLAYDYVVSGSFYLEIRWSLDFSRIASISYIPWFRIRPEEEDEEGVIRRYWYSKRWNDEKGERRIEPVAFPAFDPSLQVLEGEIPEDHPKEWTQILAVKRTTTQEYFGEPTYISAVDDIYTDSMLQNYLLNTARDGFTPSVVVSLPGKPNSQEEADLEVRGIEERFSILGNAKKVLVTRGDDNGNFAKIDTLSVQNFDTSVTSLKEIITQNILCAHSVTSPELFAVPVPGKLGGSDLEIQWNIFYNNTILPDRQPVESTINRLLKINGGQTQITFETIKTFEV